MAFPDPATIEALHLRATRPRQELEYDGWLIRRTPDDVKRARSVNVLGPSTLPHDEKVDQVEHLYSEAGLPPLFRLTDFGAPAGLDDMLAKRGYSVLDPTLQQVASLDSPLSTASQAAVSFRRLTLDDWLPIAANLRGLSQASQAAERTRLQNVPLKTTLLLGQIGDQAIACGLVLQDAEFAAPADIFVAQQQRSQGVATALSAELLRTAQANGARYAWLNVLATNEPAIRTYARLGFKTLYEYWYRIKHAM